MTEKIRIVNIYTHFATKSRGLSLGREKRIYLDSNIKIDAYRYKDVDTGDREIRIINAYILMHFVCDFALVIVKSYGQSLGREK